MKLVYLSLFTLLLATCHAQYATESSLIVAEYRVDSTPIADWTYLMAYNFKNGYLTSKDTIWSGETGNLYAKLHISFSFGVHFIYKNRYIIAGNGTVFDLKRKKFFPKETHDFIGAKNNLLLFYDSFDGYFLLNLKNRSYSKINKQKVKSLSPLLSSKVIIKNCKQKGNNFLLGEQEQQLGVRILYKEQDIGRVWCFPYHTFYNEHYLATEWGKEGKPLGFDSTKGFKMWDSSTKKWVNYEVPWLCDIIGWVEKTE